MLPYQLITSSVHLKKLLPQWSTTPVLAMDTEIAHAHQVPSRRQTVSLIQLWDGAADEIWLIDALALDLTPFIEQVMMNPAVSKIFHDAPQDLKVLRCPRRARSVICTFQMAKARQQPFCNLKALSADLLNVTLDKKYQLSNWALRPLTDDQLHYAALDAWVTYLVWDKLKAIPIPVVATDDPQAITS